MLCVEEKKAKVDSEGKGDYIWRSACVSDTKMRRKLPTSVNASYYPELLLISVLDLRLSCKNFDCF